MGRLGDFKRGLIWVGFLSLVLTGGVQNARADFTFGRPVNLGPMINSPAIDAHPSISVDGLSLFFYSVRSGGYGNRDIWVATRATRDEDWTTLENVGPPVNTSYRDSGPGISADALTLFLDSDRPGGSGDSDIWVTTRATDSDPWGTPVNLGPVVNASSYDAYPNVSADGLVLFFQSDRPGGYGGNNIWMTSRETKDDPWTTPVNLGPAINTSAGKTSAGEGDPSISSDGLALFFCSSRPGGYGSSDLYVARRATTKDQWSPPMNLGPVINSLSMDFGPSVSADGSTLYFVSLRSGSGDLWWAPITRIVDFNGDEIVDITDLVKLIERWGQNEPSVDIGPMPWGDGVVDAADLQVLMSYWQQEILDPALAGYWRLDEAEGSIAQNSVSTNHGTLYGQPLWQPTGGKKAGALQFDGINDYISTDSVLNPADGPFSVFAWIQGGAPGQVIVSQATGADWLMASSPGGALMSDLRLPGRHGQSLTSSVVITDGAWHRVGFVWDGSNRILYVDAIEVARDTQSTLVASASGLYIGGARNLAAGSFWSGLIDDVRIYNQAVKP